MTKTRKVGDEVVDVMRCLRESLREPAFTTVVVRIVSGNVVRTRSASNTFAGGCDGSE
jgi:hypothetical protein